MTNLAQGEKGELVSDGFLGTVMTNLAQPQGEKGELVSDSILEQ